MRDFDEWRWALQSPWGKTGLWAAVLCAVCIVALGIYSTRGERLGRRVLLALLRLGSVLAALVLFFQPAIQLENVTRLPNHIAVLVDQSASMTLAEKPDGPSRAARAARFLGDAAPIFESWRQQHHVDFFGFGARSAGKAEVEPVAPARLSDPAALTPQLAGDTTHLREALTAVRSRYEGKELGGVLVISDGIDNGRFADELLPAARGEGPLDAAGKDFLRALDAPVHTVFTGERGLRDVAVARVLADDFAFARNVVKVEAVLRVLGGGALGLDGKKLAVHLKRDGVTVRTVEVTVDPQRPEQKVTFEITPDRVGKYLYEVETPVLPGDAIPENNARAFVLKVIRDKIRVLLVAGRPSWDERFLRGLLKHNPNVDLISFFILRTPNDVEAVSPDEMSLIPFPTEELFLQQLRSFDLVILQNFNYAPYGIGVYLSEIRDYVQEGGGLAMIGGDLSFTSGGYADSPVAEVLPVELLDKSLPDEQLLNAEPFKLRLTPEGRGHPITAFKLDPKENLAHWEALPALDGANLVAGAKPGATVLGVHPTLRTPAGKPLPILTAWDTGKGRSLAFLSDSSWRWGFSSSATTAQHTKTASAAEAKDKSETPPGDGEDTRGQGYQKFWESAMRWLVRDPELRLLRVEADRGEYPLGDKPRITIQALDAEYRPAKSLEVSLFLSRIGAPQSNIANPTNPPSAETTPPISLWSKSVTTDENGEAQIELDALPAGGYRIIGRAKKSTTESNGALQAAQKDEDLFLVRGASRELESPEANDTLLKAIAENTDATYLGELPNPAKLKDLEFRKPEVVRVNKHRDLELWSTWITLVVAAGLLIAEWIIRRRGGLL